MFDSYDVKDECGRNTWKSTEFTTRKYFEKECFYFYFLFLIQSGKHYPVQKIPVFAG